ncbi:hypothetical protein [Pseudoalteromonas sp. Of11M-6]|uniref:hypothetical protein n=1 Tax=Pseudoalteromonas sp. Of11M-6 TaxID=2917754 RepID=UPI001EF5DD63|nr:hypothetical protein [Pseudoalteromonas sp. Of11M-6]MCG7554499.1 hypothetical protein [Pseudoalteromonas sp. Of11M-6]
MSLAELKQYISQSIQSGQLQISEAFCRGVELDCNKLNSFVDKYFPYSSCIAVDQLEPPWLDMTSVVVDGVGKGEVFNNLSLELRFFIIDSQPDQDQKAKPQLGLFITAKGQNCWHLTDSFTTIKNVDELSFNRPIYRFATHNGLGMTGEGLYFRGKPQFDSELSTLKPLLPAVTEQLAGQVEFETGGPVFDFIGEINPACNLDFLNIENLGYTLHSRSYFNNSDYQLHNQTYMSFKGLVRFDKDNKLPIELTVFGTEEVQLDIQPDDLFQTGLQKLEHFAADQDLSLPANMFSFAQNIHIDNISARVDLSPEPSVKALTINLAKTSDVTWTLIQDLIELSDLSVQLHLDRGLDHKSGATTVSGIVEGLFNIGQSGVIKLKTSFTKQQEANSYYLSGALQKGPLKTAEIFEYFLPFLPESVPSVDIEKLYFELDSASENYKIEFVATNNDWWIIQNKLAIREFSFRLNKQQPTIRLDARGSFELCQCQFFIESFYDTDTGWLFKGGSAENQTIPLGNIVVEFASLFDVGNIVPDFIQNTILEDLLIEFNADASHLLFGGKLSLSIMDTPVVIEACVRVDEEENRYKRSIKGQLEIGKAQFSLSFEAEKEDEQQKELLHGDWKMQDDQTLGLDDFTEFFGLHWPVGNIIDISLKSASMDYLEKQTEKQETGTPAVEKCMEFNAKAEVFSTGALFQKHKVKQETEKKEQDKESQPELTEEWGYLLAMGLNKGKTLWDLLPQLKVIEDYLKISDLCFSVSSFPEDTAVKLLKQKSPITDLIPQPFLPKAGEKSKKKSKVKIAQGLNLYGCLEFGTPLFSALPALIDFGNDSDENGQIKLYALINEEDQEKTLFEAQIENVTLVSLIKFDQFAFRYTPAEKDKAEFIGEGKIKGLEVGFDGKLELTEPQAKFDSEFVLMESPLGIPGINFDKASVHYLCVYATKATEDTPAKEQISELSLTGEVSLGDLILKGEILFKDSEAAVVAMKLDGRLSIIALFDQVLGGLLGDIKEIPILELYDGQIYYQGTEEKIVLNEHTYLPGFHLNGHFDIFGVAFDADLGLKQDKGLEITGSKTKPIDLGPIQFTGKELVEKTTDTGEKEKVDTGPSLAYIATTDEKSAELGFGFHFLGLTFKQGGLGWHREKQGEYYKGAITYDGSLIGIKDPSLEVKWSEERGFEILHWPMEPIIEALDLMREMDNFSLSGKSTCESIKKLLGDILEGEFDVDTQLQFPTRLKDEDSRSGYYVPLCLDIKYTIYVNPPLIDRRPVLTAALPTFHLEFHIPTGANINALLKAISDSVLGSVKDMINTLMDDPVAFGEFLAAIAGMKAFDKAVESFLCRGSKNKALEKEAKKEAKRRTDKDSKNKKDLDKARNARSTGGGGSGGGGLGLWPLITVMGLAFGAMKGFGSALGLLELFIPRGKKSEEQEQAEKDFQEARGIYEESKKELLSLLATIELDAEYTDKCLAVSWSKIEKGEKNEEDEIDAELIYSLRILNENEDTLFSDKYVDPQTKVKLVDQNWLQEGQPITIELQTQISTYPELIGQPITKNIELIDINSKWRIGQARIGINTRPNKKD